MTRKDTTPVAPIAYSVAKAAELLSISQRQVYRMVEAGDLPARRVGRRVLIPAAALTAFMAEAS